MPIDRTTDLGDRKVFEGPEVEIALVTIALDRDGIPIETAWDQTRGRQRGAIYVCDAADVERAQAVVARHLKGVRASAGPAGAFWRCPSCGEHVEPQFDACWKCGHAREARS